MIVYAARVICEFSRSVFLDVLLLKSNSRFCRSWWRVKWDSPGTVRSSWGTRGVLLPPRCDDTASYAVWQESPVKGCGMEVSWIYLDFLNLGIFTDLLFIVVSVCRWRGNVEEPFLKHNYNGRVGSWFWGCSKAFHSIWRSHFICVYTFFDSNHI